MSWIQDINDGLALIKTWFSGSDGLLPKVFGRKNSPWVVVPVMYAIAIGLVAVEEYDADRRSAFSHAATTEKEFYEKQASAKRLGRWVKLCEERGGEIEDMVCAYVIAQFRDNFRKLSNGQYMESPFMDEAILKGDFKIINILMQNSVEQLEQGYKSLTRMGESRRLPLVLRVLESDFNKIVILLGFCVVPGMVLVFYQRRRISLIEENKKGLAKVKKKNEQ